MDLLFVYGSLKEGFPNSHINAGTRIPGLFKTVLPHPFYLVDDSLPCLMPHPGSGLQVEGELYRVNAEHLVRMDELEEVGQPGGYKRDIIEVESTGAGADPITRFKAFVYMQDTALLDHGGPHTGPLACYTHEHALRLGWRGDKSGMPSPAQKR